MHLTAVRVGEADIEEGDEDVAAVMPAIIAARKVLKQKTAVVVKVSMILKRRRGGKRTRDHGDRTEAEEVAEDVAGVEEAVTDVCVEPAAKGLETNQELTVMITMKGMKDVMEVGEKVIQGDVHEGSEDVPDDPHKAQRMSVVTVIMTVVAINNRIINVNGERG